MADVEKEELRVFAAVREHDALLEHLLENAEEDLRIVRILLNLRVDVLEHEEQEFVELLRQSVLSFTTDDEAYLRLHIASAVVVVVVHKDFNLMVTARLMEVRRWK